MKTQLLAGVARSDITPPLGIGHAGWGAQAHQRAAGVDLPLWMTALAIGDGEQTCVLIDIDAMYLFEQEAAAVRQAVAALTGLPGTHIRISYTHTHSGPISGSTWSSWMDQGTEMVANYDERLRHEAAGVAWAAIRNLTPVRIGAGHGTSRIAVNRRYRRPEDDAIIVGRNPAGPVDHEVQLVRLDTVEGAPLAAIVNYACHPITVGPDNDLITPDYPGVVKRVVEQATGARCLFLQGACGDVGPIRGVARNGRHEYRRLGAMLGHEAARIWWEMELPGRVETYAGTLDSGAPLAMYDETPLPDIERRLRIISREIPLPTRQIGDPDLLAAEFSEHAAVLDRLRVIGAADETIRHETMLAKRAAMRAALARDLAGRSQRAVEIQGIAFGPDIALLAMSAEPFVKIGQRIKAHSPFPSTLVSGYSNVGWAYLPTADAYPLGGYEVEVTPFAPEAADLMVEASQAVLRDIAD